MPTLYDDMNLFNAFEFQVYSGLMLSNLKFGFTHPSPNTRAELWRAIQIKRQEHSTKPPCFGNFSSQEWTKDITTEYGTGHYVLVGIARDRKYYKEQMETQKTKYEAEIAELKKKLKETQKLLEAEKATVLGLL